jgi:GNAT superfamily N-acetyltransferase
VSRFRIEKLARKHELAAFDCGNEALNRFLNRFAWQNQQANAAQTYLGLADDAVVGFYTLVVGEVAFEGAPSRLPKGLARHPIPILLLARMGVAVDWQGRGIGAGLLKDAMLRTVGAADIAGIRAFLVHAKDENARRFYEHLGFEPFLDEPLTLYRLIKDIRSAIGATQSPGFPR